MTFHEMLAAVAIAQEVHAKPESEGGHGGPLTLNCFLEALGQNAFLLGVPRGFLTSNFKAKLPVLIRKGWLTACDDRCGGGLHIGLSDGGVRQLDEWNEKGCGSHITGRGRRPHRGRCVAPELMRQREAA